MEQEFSALKENKMLFVLSVISLFTDKTEKVNEVKKKVSVFLSD